MTHLELAQEWIKRLRMKEFSDFSSGVREFARYLDEQEKPKCEQEMLPRLKCNKPKGHEGNHATDEVQPTPVPEELKWQEPAVATFSMNQIEENTRCISENIATIGKLLARSLQPRNQ